MKLSKSQYFIPILLFALALFAAGCTRNNGNIGKQFGQWKVTGFALDGEENPEYQGNMFWSFQNTTVEIKFVNDNHQTVTTFGNYRIFDDTLFITFPDEDRQPPQGLGLKPYVENELHILRLTGSEMILSYTPYGIEGIHGDEATMLLTLKKW